LFKRKYIPVLLILALIVSLVGVSLRTFTNTSSAPLFVTATAPALGTFANYAVVGQAGVTQSGTSLWGAVDNGTPSVVGAAQTAYSQMRGQSPGITLTTFNDVIINPGVYTVGADVISGTLTLDGTGVYVLLADALTFSGSISLINGAQPCNVYWAVASATMSGGIFNGTIVSASNITFTGTNGAVRAGALTASVTLSGDTFTEPICAATATAVATRVPTNIPVGTTTSVPTPTGTLVPSPTETPISTPTETVLPIPTGTPVPYSPPTAPIWLQLWTCKGNTMCFNIDIIPGPDGGCFIYDLTGIIIPTSAVERYCYPAANTTYVLAYSGWVILSSDGHQSWDSGYGDKFLAKLNRERGWHLAYKWFFPGYPK
jgi:hypothetical protein